MEWLRLVGMVICYGMLALLGVALVCLVGAWWMSVRKGAKDDRAERL